MAAVSIVYGVEGMHCEHCVMRVRKALAGVTGVTRVEIDLEKGRARLELAEPVPDFATLAAAVDGVGYRLVEVREG
jgi:copper chaperone CopZ